MKKLIILIVILLVLVLIYGFFFSYGTEEFQSGKQRKQSYDNYVAQQHVKESVAVEADTESEKVYQNSTLNFQVYLPAGSSLSEQTQLGLGGQIFYLKSTRMNDLSYFRQLDVEKSECAAGTNTTINGIPFVRTTDSGYFGGMETGSVDGFYCTMKNGLSYTFRFSVTYNSRSGDGSVATQPDLEKSLWEFDQEMFILKFSFLN